MLAEWGKLREVAVHKPGYEVLFGLIDPHYFLFERRFNLNKARKEHDELRERLKEEGVKVYLLRKVLVDKIRRDEKFREKVQKILGIESDDPHFLVDSLILRPRIENGGVIVDPLPNLYFMRDQQITTDKGIIVGRMAKRQRRRETEVLKLFWEALGVNFKEIERGKLEGGDYFPMGDFHIIGVGIRSDLEGASSIFDLGEVAVVYKTRPEFFHLDTFFNVPSSNTVVGVKKLMQESRTEVYYYGKLVKTTNLYDYIKEKGFNVIEVEEKEAREYLTNFLTLDDGKILSPKDSKKFRGFDVITINVENLTGGMGGIRCMTAVVKRD